MGLDEFIAKQVRSTDRVATAMQQVADSESVARKVITTRYTERALFSQPARREELGG